jgi:hypothetical protein
MKKTLLLSLGLLTLAPIAYGMEGVEHAMEGNKPAFKFRMQANALAPVYNYVVPGTKKCLYSLSGISYNREWTASYWYDYIVPKIFRNLENKYREKKAEEIKKNREETTAISTKAHAECSFLISGAVKRSLKIGHIDPLGYKQFELYDKCVQDTQRDIKQTYNMLNGKI